MLRSNGGRVLERERERERMWRAGVRFFSSKVAAQQRPTKLIENLLKQHGPQTVNDCWKLAEPAGIKSKTHMKTMLHWLVERDRVEISCNHLKPSGQKKAVQKKGGRHQKSGQGFKEFLFGIRVKRVKVVESNESPKPDEAMSSGDLPEEQQVKPDEATSSGELPEEQRVAV